MHGLFSRNINELQGLPTARWERCKFDGNFLRNLRERALRALEGSEKDQHYPAVTFTKAVSMSSNHIHCPHHGDKLMWSKDGTK